jgi:alpha,alpha-trehalase
MKSYILPLPLFILFFAVGCKSSTKEEKPVANEISLTKPQSPDELFGPLFTAVQMQKIFPDGKTFVDCTPKRAASEIMYDYGMQQGAGFDLKAFVLQNFELPEQPPVLEVGGAKDIRNHMNGLWELLTRVPDQVNHGGSLLPLPNPYVVPGGRFREIYYWDSYFTMLGLAVSGRIDLIENMVANFAHLIHTYGHIPNGNRSYYLSRSQPPFFSLMVQLLAENKKDDGVYDTYLDAIEKEYMYWMDGDKEVKPGEALKKVVKLPDGTFMNRYCDEAMTPRPESYREDVETATRAAKSRMASMRFKDSASAAQYETKLKHQVYNDLRSGAESGWDFSSRWFGEKGDIESIQTTQIIPVDLNSLLYFTEKLLATQYRRLGNNKKAGDFEKWAKERGEALLKYCYNNNDAGFFMDYHFVDQKPTGKITAAGFFPLCVLDNELLQKVRKSGIEDATGKMLLAPGGILTTPLNVRPGQQWDNPNGWAPLQWMAIWGLERMGSKELAGIIAKRWIQLNKDVFTRTGKMMEKYNVVNTKLDAGGGEYPGQDGFGWSNGVLLALMEKYGE